MAAGGSVPAVGLHAPYTVSPDLYRRLQAIAERLGVPPVTHLAETQEESRSIAARFWRTPVRHLAQLGGLTDRMIAAHCVWVDADRQYGLLDP